MELKGSLSNFSLPDIVQLIGSTKRTGALVIKIGPDKANIYFDSGTIVHAEFRELTGQESITRVFREEEGSFQFLADQEAPARTVALDWMNVLMEAARLQDEGGKAFTQYHVALSLRRADHDQDKDKDEGGGALHWTAKRHYSEFVALRRALLADPALPPLRLPELPT